MNGAPTSIAIAMPGSLWPEQSGDAAYDGLRVPQLTGALAISAAQNVEISSWSAWLMQSLTGVTHDVPFALCAAHNAGLCNVDATETWLRADPVHYVAGREDVALGSLHDFNVSEAEAAQLIAALNAHFAQDGLTWHAIAPRQWLLRVPGALDAQTVDPWAGVNMPARYVPMLGADARRLRKWTTEAQMILYEHPINLARQARGERAVNSVWMWASGSALPAAQIGVSLATSCLQAKSLGNALKLPETAPQVLGYFPGLMMPFLESDAEKWRAKFAALFETSLAPHLQNAQPITLILGGQRPQVCVPLTKKSGVRGWIKNVFSNDAELANELAALGKLQ
jgi:hypothetical protein